MLDCTKGLYINGQWVEGVNTIKNINPSDIDNDLGDVAQADKKQVELAIDAAKEAQVSWEKTPLEEKANLLYKIGESLMNRSDEIGKIISLEEGKTKIEGKGEVFRSGQFFQYYAAEVLRQIGENAASVRSGVDVEITREAVGVVGIISPWNFPIATASWKIAPALCFGNSIVWKPANTTPASAVALAEIIHEHGLPSGVFNLVLGSGGEVGETIINSRNINALSFTGSVDVGRKIARATAANFVKCQLEMGSKNALVIMDDADLDLAVECAIAGAFSGTGQKCTASSRLIVMESIHDAFVEKMVSRMKTLKVGHCLDDGIFMGPVADNKQFESNFKWVQRAKDLGAELVFGGEKLSLDKNGYYMSPTLFINTKNDWDVNQEEIFAPLACVIKAKDLQEAVALNNGTRFGLTSGIVTSSLKNANIFKKEAKSGCVMINLPTAGTDYHVPFGGRKESSFGPREQGSYAKEFYTVVKTTYVKAY
ncbi:aldehyde dehydrogenase family protein [Campylobacter sp. IFREMER_LSEM_CL2194]|uniref:aldehyde dehydrogenase family protein n=1 Tax=Campylobacter sp. IFREMER_LSEM_CL2194 TaxID=2911621 RepID=UPI0021E705FF|nr:aldehyde dehydrogenase family protein [Campylobacter sp. IFREMER_LSEM_CL2194]MCV3377360.1 aldehyde dehydrogenase family protein [Campylobacter sp. IFREMER_LSEM_CL2194]